MITPYINKCGILIYESDNCVILKIPFGFDGEILTILFKDKKQIKQFTKLDVNDLDFTEFFTFDELFVDQDRKRKKDKIKYNFAKPYYIDLTNMSLSEFIKYGIEYYGKEDWDKLFTYKK